MTFNCSSGTKKTIAGVSSNQKVKISTFVTLEANAISSKVKIKVTVIPGTTECTVVYTNINV